MRKGPSNATKWFYWFSLGVALLIAHAILSNVAGIYSFASRIALVLMPFFLAIIIAFLFFKPASSLEHFIKNKLKIKKGARAISILIVYVIFGLLIFLFGRNLYNPIKDSLTELVESVPGYLNEAKTFIRENRDNQILAAINIDKIIEKVNSFDLSTYISPERIFDYIEKVKGVFTTILDIFVVIILSIYILLGRGSIKEYLKKFGKAMFDKKDYLKYGTYFLNSIRIISNFISCQLLDGCIIAILASIAMSIIGVKYSVLLGIFIGLFNLIPFFGAIIAIGISVLITVFTGGIKQALIMAAVVIIIQQIDANIINPKILGDGLDVNPILVIISVSIGGELFGIFGMFIAVPIAAIIKMILTDYFDERIEYKKKFKDEYVPLVVEKVDNESENNK